MHSMKDKQFPTLNVWDAQAIKYDRRNHLMEGFYGKWRKIYLQLKGRILEVGTGTGNNLPFYNPNSKVTASDWSPHMVEVARNKIKRIKLEYVEKVIVANIEHLSNYFEPHSFDYITSTCVFCSVPNPLKGLREIAKVIRPSGRLIQIEHGISNNQIINLGLKFMDPIISRVRGFHVTRNIAQNLMISGFKIDQVFPLDRFGIFHILISHPTN